jgi:hypothetical protein
MIELLPLFFPMETILRKSKAKLAQEVEHQEHKSFQEDCCICVEEAFNANLDKDKDATI